MMRFFYTLKFQIGLAIFCLILPLAGAIIVSQFMLEELLNTEKIIQLGGKLQKSSQHMAMQAMNYTANTPDDSSTYDRDLNLYYKDLMSHVETFDMIEDAFMSKQFSTDMTGMDDMMEASLSDEVEGAVKTLHQTWLAWRKKLMSQLGDSVSMPHLFMAAEFIKNNGNELAFATDQLMEKLAAHAQSRKTQLEKLNHILLVISVITVLVIILWFYKRVIARLEATSQGMQKIALGNFQYQLAAQGKDEITQMNQQFNHLSNQLSSLFQVMTSLHEGSNLDEILRFISEEFPRLLPLDWIGILFVIGDGKIQLEKGYADRHAENFGSIRFDLEGTLLQASLESQQPLHIPDIEVRLKENKVYKFLNILVQKQCKEAIFVPLEASGALPGVLVFASKQSHAYTPEHLSLLKNLSMLITLSFSRTVKLAEYQHLAAIGRFATGIAHEIRSPLATINMALDYFKTGELNDSLKKRAQLAGEEAERVKRLMEDILLYAKPLQIKTTNVDLAQTIRDIAQLYTDRLQAKSLRFELISSDSSVMVEADADRIKQVFINLLLNAIQASAHGGSIVAILTTEPDSQWVNLQLTNYGETVPAKDLERIFEPFYTTRAHGTGLGLNIAKRIVEAHGGEISAESAETAGSTIFELTLPPAR